MAHDHPTLLGAAIQGVACPAGSPKRRLPKADCKQPFAITTPGVFLYYPGRPRVLPKLLALVEQVKHQGLAQWMRQKLIAAFQFSRNPYFSVSQLEVASRLCLSGVSELGRRICPGSQAPGLGLHVLTNNDGQTRG
jgi:hypothetical protein